jgi:LacI family transcriptional regulator
VLQNDEADRPTILDVARHCGLSKATVSKALNAPDGSTLVSDHARARVRRAVEELGYRPSWRGQVLARRRSQAIAIAYSAPVGAVPRGVYWEIVDSLEEFLGARDYIPTFLHLRQADDRVERMLGDGRFDGCISLGLIAPPVLEMMRRHRVPAVLINSNAGPEWCRVNVNDLGGGRLLMRHLLDLGHRRILYYAGKAVLDHPSARDRYEAYRVSMIEAGLKPRPPFVGAVEDFAKTIKAGGRDAPTAVVDFEHFSAIRLLQALWRQGVRVPDDVSVGTFNDTHPAADVIPPLTTVALPGREMARQAVEMLLRKLDDADFAQRTHTVTLDESLVVRESTGVPRGNE